MKKKPGVWRMCVYHNSLTKAGSELNSEGGTCSKVFRKCILFYVISIIA